MLKFLNNIFLKEKKIEKKINFKMDSSKLKNYSIDMCWNYPYIIVHKSKTFIYWTKEEYPHIQMFVLTNNISKFQPKNVFFQRPLKKWICNKKEGTIENTNS
jgi:hypothetical protein